MENLKLKMIDFTGKSENVVSERDMIFSFNIVLKMKKKRG